MIEDILSFMYLHPEITVVGAVTLIQIAPIKIDPWTRIARWIRKAITGDLEKKIDKVTEKVDGLEDQITRVTKKVDGLEDQAAENQAVQARTHILRFADELYDKREHSQEYFLQMLDDIKTYHKYCADHPDFPNGRTTLACEKIKEVYNRLWSEHKF